MNGCTLQFLMKKRRVTVRFCEVKKRPTFPGRSRNVDALEENQRVLTQDDLMRAANPAHDLALIKRGLAVTDVFSSWPEGAMEMLLAASRLGRYQRGALVQSEEAGQPHILLVLSGHLMMGRADIDGSRLATALLGPGMFVGVPQQGRPLANSCFDYRAHDAAVVVHLRTSVAVECLQASPMLWSSMAGTLLKQERELLITLLHQLSGPLRQRLAASLCRLVQLFGVKEGTKYLRLRLSQEDLASMLQVTRQSINREMRAFEKEALIGVEYRSVVVKNVTALRWLGCGDATNLRLS